MNSRSPGLVLLALGSAACDAGPEPVSVTAFVGVQYEFPEGKEQHHTDDIRISWTVIDAPIGSAAMVSNAENTGLLKPDLRGRFIIDRWVEVGTLDRWTHRYYIDVFNAPPIPVIAGPAEGRVSMSMYFDGRSSTDTEAEMLEYQWRLSYRPKDSEAFIEAGATEAVTFRPDQPGLYGLELSVFDGEIWSEESSNLELSVEP